jgi:maltose/moltooligosaccharide transporter
LGCRAADPAADPAIIGHYSDRTWTRFGRRRPYFLPAVLAALAMFAMSEAPIL